MKKLEIRQLKDQRTGELFCSTQCNFLIRDGRGVKCSCFIDCIEEYRENEELPVCGHDCPGDGEYVLVNVKDAIRLDLVYHGEVSDVGKK